MYINVEEKARLDLGILRPTTPATTGPEWQPILISISLPVPGSLKKKYLVMRNQTAYIGRT